MARPKKTKALDAKAATVSTATINIKVVQVGKQKMSMAVFRQLPQRKLVNDIDLRIEGTAWGHVNYHWGNQNPTHLHVLYENDGRLYRDLVDPRPSDEWPRTLQGRFGEDSDLPLEALEFWHRLMDVTAAWYYAMLLRGEALPGHRERRYRWSPGYTVYAGRLEESNPIYELGETRCFSLDDGSGFRVEVHVAAHQAEHGGRDDYWHDQLTLVLTKLLKAKPPFVETSVLAEQVKDAAKHFGEFGKVWDDFMSPIAKLEQLFIAT